MSLLALGVPTLPDCPRHGGPGCQPQRLSALGPYPFGLRCEPGAGSSEELKVSQCISICSACALKTPRFAWRTKPCSPQSWVRWPLLCHGHTGSGSEPAFDQPTCIKLEWKTLIPEAQPLGQGKSAYKVCHIRAQRVSEHSFHLIHVQHKTRMSACGSQNISEPFAAGVRLTPQEETCNKLVTKPQRLSTQS